MDMKRIIHKRAVSLVLAFLMAASCTFNIAAADSGSTDYVDSQNGNSAKRVYDSGNVVLSNEIVPVKKDTYKIKLNIDIHNIDKFLLKGSSEDMDDEAADDVSSTSGAEKTEVKDSGAASSASAVGTDKADGLTPGANAQAGSTAETTTSIKGLQSFSAIKSAFPNSDYPAIASRALADAESKDDSAESKLEELKYEVRYYIEKGFMAVESSIPKTAELIESKSGPYVSWPDLSLDEVKNFTNGVQVQKDDSDDTESQTAFGASSEQTSGLYREGVQLYAFGTPELASDPYFYVPVNLYKYSRDPVPGTNSMKINEACKSAASAASHKSGQKIRGISFDKITNLSTNFNGDWNKYNNAIFPGIVRNELDGNGNLQWGETDQYKYVAANLFGPKDVKTGDYATDYYRTDYTNVAFPLLKGANGSYSFDSKTQRGVYNGETNKVEIREEQDITYQKNNCAQFSPFYTGDGDQNSNQDRNASWSFGMNMNIQFTMPENGRLNDGTPMQFEFSGDDDVWIFIDQKLVLDIGGIHQAKSGSIDFSSGTARTTDGSKVTDVDIYGKGISRDAGKLHTLSMFYLERGAGYSNFKMSCNLLQSSAFEVGKKLEGQTGDTTFRFKAEAGGKPFGEVPFDIYNVNGTSTGETGETDADGKFSLKAGQKAVFAYSNPVVNNKISSLGTAITVKELGATNYQTDYTVTTGGKPPETKQNNKTAIITVPDPNAFTQTVNLTFTNKPGLGQFTITKKVVRAQGSDEQDASADSSQFFTFKIEQYASDTSDDAIENSTVTPLSTFYEVIYTTGGTGSKTITNLSWGKYRVTEISDTAWRYTPKDSEPKVISVGENNPEVSCRNYLSNAKWISGKDSVTNVFTVRQPC